MPRQSLQRRLLSFSLDPCWHSPYGCWPGRCDFRLYAPALDVPLMYSQVFSSDTTQLMANRFLDLQLQLLSFGIINGHAAGKSFTSWLNNAVALVPLTVMLWLRTSKP